MKQRQTDLELQSMLRQGYTVQNVRDTLGNLNDTILKRNIIHQLEGINERLRQYIPLRVANNPRENGIQTRPNRN